MIILFLILTTLFGIAVLSLFDKKVFSSFEKLGLGILVGVSSETIFSFVLFAVFNTTSFDLFVFIKILEVIFILYVFIFLRKKFLTGLSMKLTLLQILPLLIIFLLFCLSLLYTIYTPVHTTDAVYYFDFRSKIMYLSGSVSDIKIIPNWSYYPMFTSMLGLLSRLSGIENPSYYFPIIYLAFAIVFNSCLRRFINNKFSLCFTVLMFSTPLLFWQSRLDNMTNLSYSVYFAASFIYSLVFLKEKNAGFAFLTIFFAGISKWIRIQEPFWIIPLLFVAVDIVIEKRAKLLFCLLLLFVLVIQVWPGYIRLTYGSMSGVNTSVALDDVSNVVTDNIVDLSIIFKKLINVFTLVFRVMWQNLSPVFQILLIIIPISFFKGKVNKYELLNLAGIFLLFGGLVVSIVYGTLVWNWIITLENSLSRLISFFVPIAWFYIALVIDRIFIKKEP